ncbi:hypothetical protein HDU97_008627 [Phlyctochytrium planicorne]|nr:hypothetical protein HDU97_008627 [Phlyctochytrium planicorne]
MALRATSTSVGNLPGGGESNQAVTLTSDLHSWDTAFKIEPANQHGRKSEVFHSRFSPKTVNTDDAFLLVSLNTGKNVFTNRDKQVLTYLGGEFYGVIASHVGSFYQKPIAMSWKIQNL